MPTTQLFVELLVIGFGTATWLGILAGAVFRWHLPEEIPDVSAGPVLALTVVAYVLGIIMDRLARAVWGKWLVAPKDIHGTPTPEAERKICKESERLWSTCAYNRSRFRICRAWTLNCAFIAITYIVWNLRVQDHKWPESAFIVLIVSVLCIASAWATVRLYRDYYAQIDGVYPFV